MTQKSLSVIDTGRHRRRLAKRLQDPTFRREYERARAEIRQIDQVIRSLDELREAAGVTKAELARSIGKDPASIRRLFTAASNPELKTIAALATALGARIQVVPAGRKSRYGGRQRVAASRRTAAPTVSRKEKR